MNRFGSLSQQDILDIENRLNMQLPDDYKNFLMDTNGGTFEQASTKPVLIKALNEEIHLDVLFGIVDEKNLNLLYWNEKYSDEILENTILIGFDLMQGFIVLINDGQNNGVYYWDDSYHFEASNDESNMYFLAKDFEDFFNRVREQHF